VRAAEGQPQLACRQRVIAAYLVEGDTGGHYAAVTGRHQVDGCGTRCCVHYPDPSFVRAEVGVDVVVEHLDPEGESVAIGWRVAAEEIAQPAEEPIVAGVIEVLGDQQSQHGDGVVAAVTDVK